MMSTGTNSRQAVDDDFDIIFLSTSHDSLQGWFATKHSVYGASINSSKWRGVLLSVLKIIRIFVLKWIVVSFEGTHEIQSRDSLFGIIGNTLFDITEGSSLDELVTAFIDSCILIINLDLVERVIFHTLSMYHKSTLGNAANLFISLFIWVIEITSNMWENWIGLANNLEWLKFSIVGDGNETPVVETTLPEFTEINGDLILSTILAGNVSLLNFVPCK